MLNLYEQIGGSGIAIIILSFAAIFAAVRGIVQLQLIRRQSADPKGVMQQIANELKQTAGSEQPLLLNALIASRLAGAVNSMHFLKFSAAVGTLLGLLGTVTGMVKVFSAIAQSALPDPAQLAGGIWQALLTTVMGLSLAVPALAAHYYLLQSLRRIKTKITLILNAKA